MSSEIVSGEYPNAEPQHVQRDRRKCCHYREQDKYCNAYCTQCHGSAHCAKYRVDHFDHAADLSGAVDDSMTQDHESLIDIAALSQPPIKSSFYFVKYGSIDAMACEYIQKQHACPLCGKTMRCQWQQRGCHTVIGLAHCSGRHTWFVKSLFEVIDDEALVRQQFWDISYDLIKQFYSHDSVYESDKLLKYWTMIKRNKRRK